MNAFERASADLAAFEAKKAADDRVQREHIDAIEAERTTGELAKLHELESLRVSLAIDLKVDLDMVPLALGKMHAEARSFTASIVHALMTRLWPAYGVPPADIDTARQARHALVGSLPAVRKNDRAFGSESDIRALPGVTLTSHLVAADFAIGKASAIARAFGVSPPRVLPPGVESPAAAKARLGLPNATVYGRPGRARGGVNWPRASVGEDDDRERARATAEARDKEMDLIGRRFQAALDQRREEFHQALLDQRFAIVRACDHALAEGPINEGWWWLRRARAYVAAEPHFRVLSSASAFDCSIDLIVQLARTGGCHINLKDN